MLHDRRRIHDEHLVAEAKGGGLLGDFDHVSVEVPKALQLDSSLTLEPRVLVERFFWVNAVRLRQNKIHDAGDAVYRVARLVNDLVGLEHPWPLHKGEVGLFNPDRVVDCEFTEHALLL